MARKKGNGTAFDADKILGRSKTTPDWKFIRCPVCGVAAGKDCVDLTQVALRGDDRTLAPYRDNAPAAPPPHGARIALGQSVRV
jgi:hypothetical protein